jgi:hypothetical protein
MSGFFFTKNLRITKPEGILYLEEGHQSRAKAKEKINNSGCWEIIEKTKAYMKCKPKNQTK